MPYSSTALVQRPLRVEEARAAAERGEGFHVDDAGGDKELLDDLPEGVDARGVELVLARDFLDLDALGPHLAGVLELSSRAQHRGYRMPDLTEEWAPNYKSVDIVTAVPRERDIDGVARYCFKKVARELLGAVIEPTAKPRFYYVKTATGG